MYISPFQSDTATDKAVDAVGLYYPENDPEFDPEVNDAVDLVQETVRFACACMYRRQHVYVHAPHGVLTCGHMLRQKWLHWNYKLWHAS